MTSTPNTYSPTSKTPPSGSLLSRLGSWLFMQLEVSPTLTALGALLIASVGIVHAIAMPASWEESMLGEAAMFAFNAAGGMLAPLGILRRALWGWLLGAAVAGGALAGFIVSRTIGMPAMMLMMKQMPGMMREEWMEPLALLAVGTEVIFALILISVYRTHRANSAEPGATTAGNTMTDNNMKGNDMKNMVGMPGMNEETTKRPSFATWELVVVSVLSMGMLAGGFVLASRLGNLSMRAGDSMSMSMPMHGNGAKGDAKEGVAAPQSESAPATNATKDAPKASGTAPKAPAKKDTKDSSSMPGMKM